MSHHRTQKVSLSVSQKSIAPYDLSQRPKNVQMVNEVSGEAVKQPMNPFLIWCKTKRGEMLKTQQGMRPCDVSKQLGEIWRSMSDADKKPFVDEARVLKSEHQKNHPDFKRKHKKQKNKQPVVYEAPVPQSSTPTTTSTASFVTPTVQTHQYYPALSTPTTQAPAFTAQFVPTTQHGYQYDFAPIPPTTSAQSIANPMTAGTGSAGPVTTASNLPFFF